jgi:hypothetical protein
VHNALQARATGDLTARLCCQHSLRDQAVAQVLDKLPEDHAAPVSGWMEIDQRMRLDLHEAGIAQQAGDTSSDEQVDAIQLRVGLQRLQQPGPRRMRGITQVRCIIGLVQVPPCLPATAVPCARSRCAAAVFPGREAAGRAYHLALTYSLYIGRYPRPVQRLENRRSFL